MQKVGGAPESRRLSDVYGGGAGENSRPLATRPAEASEARQSISGLRPQQLLVHQLQKQVDAAKPRREAVAPRQLNSWVPEHLGRAMPWAVGSSRGSSGSWGRGRWQLRSRPC